MGGLGSIIVGAVIIGTAIALAHLVNGHQTVAKWTTVAVGASGIVALKILDGGGYGRGDGWRIVRCAGGMRYPDGGGLAAAERARRERVRFAYLTGDQPECWADVWRVPGVAQRGNAENMVGERGQRVVVQVRLVGDMAGGW